MFMISSGARYLSESFVVLKRAKYLLNSFYARLMLRRDISICSVSLIFAARPARIMEHNFSEVSFMLGPQVKQFVTMTTSSCDPENAMRYTTLVKITLREAMRFVSLSFYAPFISLFFISC